MIFLRLPFYVIFCSIIWGTFLWLGTYIPKLSNTIQLEPSLFGWILYVLIVLSLIVVVSFCVVLPIVACIIFEIDWKDDLIWEIDFWYTKAKYYLKKFKENKK